MILKCPNCGEQYDITSKVSLDSFSMKCQSCGTEITNNDEIKVTPINQNNGSVSPPKKGKRSILKWVIVIIVVVLGLMALTCPGKEKHAEKLRQHAMQEMNNGIGEGNDFAKGLAFLIGPSFINLILDNGLYIDNYFIFNIGRIKYDDKDSPITLGVFNNVIIMKDLEN